MSREIITISKMGAVTVPTAPVWMTQFEIADLFGVFSCNIRKMNLIFQQCCRIAIYCCSRFYLTDRNRRSTNNGSFFNFYMWQKNSTGM